MAADSNDDQERQDRSHLTEVEFALVLSRMIDSLKGDPSQLRDTVYEMARMKLEAENAQRDPPMSAAEMKRMLTSLETAIHGVESFSKRRDAVEARQADRQPTYLAGPAPAHRRLPVPQRTLLLEAPERLVIIDREPARPTSNILIGRLLFAVTALIVASWLYVILDRQFGGHVLAQSNAASSAGGDAQRGADLAAESASQQRLAEAILKAAKQEAAIQQAAVPQPAVDPRFTDLPRPTVYGIYAVVDGKLNELEQLPGRVPDERVRISTPITKPSSTVLSNGNIKFVIYRRDLNGSTPDRIPVRVIAKISQVMKFDVNGVAVKPSGDLWVIRSNSYEFRVAPLSPNSEIFVVQPDKPDSTLPAGRYALVLKGQGYDFTVAGAVTDLKQCLESVEAANGTFYTECKKP